MVILNDLLEIKTHLFNSGIRYVTITQDLFSHCSSNNFIVTIEYFDEDIEQKIIHTLNIVQNVKFQLIDRY